MDGDRRSGTDDPSAEDLVRSYLHALSGDDVGAIASHVADDFRNEHLSALGEGSAGRAAYRRRLPGFLAAFPERRYEVLDVVSASGDGGTRVAVRYRLHAVHHDGSRDDGGLRARLPVEVPGMMWLTVIGGRIAARTDCWDSLTFLRQVEAASGDASRTRRPGRAAGRAGHRNDPETRHRPERPGGRIGDNGPMTEQTTEQTSEQTSAPTGDRRDEQAGGPASGRTIPTDEELRARLTPLQYEVTQDHGTERAFTGVYWDLKDDGTYHCVVCDEPLFSSDAKYDSGTGWPSFFEALDPAKVTLVQDRSFGMVRTEALCATCGAHLGHVFPDGPRPTGDRFCMNSASLDFQPRSDDTGDETGDESGDDGGSSVSGSGDAS